MDLFLDFSFWFFRRRVDRTGRGSCWETLRKMFVTCVFEAVRSGVCECVHRKRFAILKQDRRILLIKVPGTFSSPILIES